MTIFVDDVRHEFRGMILCHMWSDRSLDELFAFADALGLRRSWFQEPPGASWEHFDISLGVKREALSRGAVLTDKYGPMYHCAILDMSSRDPLRMAKGCKNLVRVWVCRQLRN